MYWFLFIITWLFVRIILPCKVVGKKNIKNFNGIVVCNHLSNADPVYIAHYLPAKLNFLAKKELFKSKFKGGVLKSIGAIPIDRKSLDLNAIKLSLKSLKSGRRLVIFPEGTRNKTDDELQELKGGCAMFAIKAKCPIIPLKIEKRFKIFRRNKLIIGTPFDLSAFYGQKLTAEVLAEAGKIVEQKMKLL